MKKFYSFVLMAAALLIGTNVWASQDGAWLQAQFDAVQANGQTATIKLTDDVILTSPIYLGTANITDARKSIKLDLNGRYIEMTAPSNKESFMFVLTHGELLICNSAAQESEIRLVGTTYNGTNANTSLFSVYGSYKSSRWNEDGNSTAGITPKNTSDEDGGYFSHLQIGTGVKILAGDACFGTGITIDAYHPGQAWVKQIDWTGREDSVLYRTDIIASQTGFAYGVQVEVMGDITVASGANGGKKSYAVKANGNLKSPLKEAGISSGSYLNDFKEGNNYLSNYSGTEHAGDKIDVPFIHIAKSAHLTVSAKVDKSTAAYSSGYAKWLVEGECKGNIGVYIKSGAVELHDAIIESNSSSYTKPSSTNGATGAGSAIVINSNGGSYDGNTEVTISGDTKVTAASGYAVEEIVTAANNQTQVQSISVEGGSFDGGNQVGGDIAVSTESKQENAVQVIGASLSNPTVTVGTGTSAITVNVSTLVPQTGDYHTTEVTVVDPNTQQEKTITVVSQGAQPEEDPDNEKTSWQYISDNQGANKSYKWTKIENAQIAADATVELDELQINSGNATDGVQQLTINNGATLKVDRLLMNNYARIIVEAGGKLIVKGTQGITAPVAENILLKSTADKQAYFLFNPAVTSNRHPNAQVQLYTNCYQMESSPKKIYVYQRLALPVMEGMKPTNDFNGSLFEGNSFTTYAWYWNGNIWASLSHWTDLKPFIGYEFANNATAGGVTYTFSGQLVGNGDAEYDFPTGGYDYFGCSHVAPIYADSLLKPFENSNMEATAWVWNFGTHNWTVINSENIKEGWAPAEIQPMTAFVLRLKGASGKAGMNYASAIWGNPNFDAILGRPSQVSPAPARNMVDDVTNRAMINVRAENGFGDAVKLIEKDYYTTEFDNGADASKFMCEDGINLYASTEAGDLACVATDNLMGTLLSFRSGSSTQYTINLSNVIGEEYALRDNVTGQVITFAEGATSTFTQEAYTTVPARFELVEVAKMPTAIENIEEVAKASGVYTMTGQYVGRDFTKLPAGVYVVNGVKIVK